MRAYLVTAIAAAALLGANVAHAADDDWIVKVGVHTVDPKSNNGTLANGALKADAGSDTEPTITAEYLFAPNWGVEVLASWPWEHQVKLNGAKAVTTKQLPPTVSAQYHFNAGGGISPFVGLGVNYTLFYNEHTSGPLAGTKVGLGNSIGPALHGGVDVLRVLAQAKFAAPIIVVSGTDDVVREESLLVARRLRLNVCGCFAKPINLARLRELLHAIRKRQLVGLTPRGA